MVFESFFSALNPLFDPLINAVGPILAVMVIAIIIAFVTTLATKLLVNQDRLAYLQKEMKEYNQEMVQARKSNDPKAMEKVQKRQMEFMSLQKEMMFMSFKPMIVTWVPVLILFYWMIQSQLNQVVLILPTFVYYVLLVPIWHAIPIAYFQAVTGNPVMSITWLGWYFLCSFGFSQVFRKLMGVKGGGMGGT
jgi:uncharacterized membrane protein (DUF106 family)